jgi:hypothetical protein
MPNRIFGFSEVDETGVTPYPGRSVAIAPTLNNTTTVTFNVTSNLPNTPMKYSIVGASTTDFVDGLVTAPFTTDSTGNASFTKTLVTISNNTSNLSFYSNVQSQNNLDLAQSSNINIINILPIIATGGTISFSNGYKVHTFNNNANLVVSNINTATNATVYVQLVGGGGAGGLGYANVLTVTSTLPTQLRKIDSYPGGGGGGGNVIQANLTVNDFVVSTYPVIVAAGGNGAITTSNISLRAGGNTTFKGYTATGGGPGGSYNLAAPDGYFTGGGGAALFTGANTIGAFHTTSNTTPIGAALYSTWFNPSVGINGVLYYKSEANVYTTWNDPEGLPRLNANVFNQQGTRIANEGGDGTGYDGANAIIGSIWLSNLYENGIGAGGGGAGALGNGYNPTGKWVIDGEINAANVIAGNGGFGVTVWGDDPTITSTSNVTLQYRRDFGLGAPYISMLGAGGGGGQGYYEISGDDATAGGGLSLARSTFLGGAAPNNTGGGGMGGSPGWDGRAAQPVASSYTVAGGFGGSGVVKIAYINTFRQFTV